MSQDDAPKTVFIINHNNYYYKVLPFDLNNVKPTYQRFMDVIFSKHIGQNLEFYIDDMVVKTCDRGNKLIT